MRKQETRSTTAGKGLRSLKGALAVEKGKGICFAQIRQTAAAKAARRRF